MGRTLPSATVVLMQEEAAFAKFRRALRRGDQLALDDLFVAARQHIAAVQFASHALPFEVYLLSMLLEEHKEVMRLRDRMEALAPDAPAADLSGDCHVPPGAAAGAEPDEAASTRQSGLHVLPADGKPWNPVHPSGAGQREQIRFVDPGFGVDDVPGDEEIGNGDGWSDD
jgi:hypothetical protein